MHTTKQDTAKVVSFGNTFRYIDYLFSVSNEGFGDYVSPIYPSALGLKETTMASNEVRYLDTRIKQEDDETPYHINFQIVNFPHMESNIPGNPPYEVCMSQLVRYARRWTSYTGSISSRLQRQGFKYALLLKSLYNI